MTTATELGTNLPKGYTLKANAVRAAKKLGLDLIWLEFYEGPDGWTWRQRGTGQDETSAADQNRPEAEENFAPPAFLTKGQASMSLTDMAAKVEAGEAIPTSDAQVATEGAAFAESDAGKAIIAEANGDFARMIAAAFNAGLLAARPTRTTTGKKARAKRDASGETKRDICAALLLRKSGCTTADILEATGWPSVSVPAIAKASGITLRKEKDGRAQRYFGTRA